MVDSRSPFPGASPSGSAFLLARPEDVCRISACCSFPSWWYSLQDARGLLVQPLVFTRGTVAVVPASVVGQG